MSELRDLIVITATGQVLDLASDLSSDDDRQLRELHRKCKFTDPPLICQSGQQPLYLQERNGNLWAVHKSGGCCPPRQLTSGMTDEHKWQTEYVVNRWTENGLDVRSEVLGERARLATGVIPDAIAYGGIVTIGAEIQRSALSVRRAVERTRLALAAGVTDIWFTDQKPPPRWGHRVPTVGMNCNKWQHAARRSATVTTGPRIVIPVKCEVGKINQCLDKKRGFCGKWHPGHEPWLGLAVDDITQATPAGEVVPLRWLGRTNSVFLVSTASLALYEELLGGPAIQAFAPAVMPPPVTTQTTGPTLCLASFPGEQLILDLDEASKLSAKPRGTCDTPHCYEPGRLYAHGCRCDKHKPTGSRWWQ